MKKRILSMVCSLLILSSLLLGSFTDVEASDEMKKVDGSYLTMDETSTGYSSDRLTKGKHMMDGECSITKAGKNRIYAYGATTGNHTVDYIAVIVYVERYHPETDRWGHVDAWIEECENDFLASTAKTLTVDTGYYYRVRADHFAEKAPDPMEETYSVTNGIWI
ncbi:hypothetical protein B5F07_15640 [Lachnoclostridium sp. An169]|uniref:DUF6147 family protein n=1 Tax=Lachnoclostridium sp. An169 TaxID=1965569 RepID=UPI000B36E3E9|nr:DUF6147 family protein [Lachnoclostridium sp. An169]OUP82021.1 hypothetical protein B5F07_15640 [Lachnoclostridium sp. An169]HJA65682.1 hypothetical protein [Candidatus Mediterraneibacter cottocaccae]